MSWQHITRIGCVLACAGSLAACGNRTGPAPEGARVGAGPVFNQDTAASNYDRSSIWDLFGPNRADQTVNVNRFLWTASLDALSFLPIQTVDPFTGVIVTGFGVPPGGGRAYRATVLITDPALEARSLRVSLQSRGGPVSAATARAVEDAILARARQIRISDNSF